MNIASSLRRMLCIGVFGSQLLAPLGGHSLHGAIFDVQLQPDKFTIYTDPYNGNQIKFGGFSGLCPVPGHAGRFFVVTDRGPAPDFVSETGVSFKTWAVPGFGPHILTVDLQPNGKAMIRHAQPLRRPDGTPITGLPTSIPATDVPYDFNLNQLPFDEDSIDAEGITIDPWGNFWVCEEYKPSVAMVAPDGRVLMRLMPEGTLTGLEIVPSFDVLPRVLARRRNNRGFEGIAASPDGILYAVVQRPLNNPNRAAADANGNARIIAIDLNALAQGQTIVRQYIYRVEFANRATATLSDLFWNGPGRLLVPERVTDTIFEADLTSATDITPLENADGRLIADTTKTIEQLDTAGLAAFNITPVSKTAVIQSLTSIDPLLEKVEGICKVGEYLVLTYDNDFNVAESASIPVNPDPNGPLVQLELIGANYPKLYLVPQP